MGNASSRGQEDGPGARLLADVAEGSARGGAEGARQSLGRAQSGGGYALAGRLAASLATVEGRGSGAASELERTPSAQRDLEVGASRSAAARAQRMRAELRKIDTEIAEASAQLRRAELLRGPSGTRHECDGNCVVGGCGEEFAEDEGVLCASCDLFLCHACFGATVVKNECQIGGRFFDDLRHSVQNSATGSMQAVALISEPGSLPCPLFPQVCSCGHIPLRTIQRAMLHPRNRGRDGDEEDISSPGTSPHKTHLLARRRWAEAQAGLHEGMIAQGTQSDMLVRTFTEARRLSLGRTVAGLSRTTSGTRAVLADRYNELAQLKKELITHPVATAIPSHLRRTCAQCREEFAAFEGGECHYFSNRVVRHSHFLCALCYGGYIMRACSEGGVFEAEIRNEAGTIVSAPGRLPCPFFHAIRSGSQLVPRTGTLVSDPAEPEPETEADPLAGPETEPEPELVTEPEPETEHVGISRPGSPQRAAALSRPASPGHDSGGDATVVAFEHQRRLPEMECRCGAVPMSSIETVLLDPRNTSIPFWRTRHAETVVRAHDEATITVENLTRGDELPPGWQVEIDHGSNQRFFFNPQTGEVSFERPPSIAWTREIELIGRGFTPANVYETARLRVAIAETTAVAEARRELEELRMKELEPDALAVAELRMRVIDALDHGGSLQCPQCGVRAVKDDACIHMDSCECGSNWCFLCGKLKSECPRGPGRGGCDEQSYYLERHQGWGNFALHEGESAAYGAQQEFLRQRQACMVRVVMESTDSQLWKTLRKKHPDLLRDTPTPGRHIDWDTLHEARFPLFGGNKRNEQQSDAQRRFEEHYEQLRIDRERHQRQQALRRRQQAFCVPSIAAAIAILLVGTSLMMTYIPPPSPVVHHEVGSESGTGAPDFIPEPEPHPHPEPEPAPPEPEPEQEPVAPYVRVNWACHSLLWFPIVELLIGAMVLLYGTVADIRAYRRNQRLVAVVLGDVDLRRCDAGTRRRLVKAFALLLFGCVVNWVGLLGLLHGPQWVLSMLTTEAMIFLIPASALAATVWLSAIIHSVLEDAPMSTLAVCNLAVLIYTGVCVYWAHSVDTALDTSEDPATQLHCDWMCVSLAVIPVVLFALGLPAMAVSSTYVLRGHGDTTKAGAAGFGAASFIAAAFCFWPSSLSAVEWLTAYWLVAYIVAPLSTCVFGYAWLVIQVFVAIELATGDAMSPEDYPVVWILPVIAFIYYIVAMVMTRSSNEDYVVPEPDFTFSCDGACQFLTYVPIVQVLVGALVCIATAIFVLGFRNSRIFFEFVGSCVSSIFIFWPILYGTKSFVTGSWLIAYILAPASLSASHFWLFIVVIIFIEKVKDRQIENLMNPDSRKRLLAAVAVISVMSTCMTIGCMVYLRRGSPEPPEPANNDTYTCTWPCAAVRAAVIMPLGGLGTMSLAIWRDMLAQRDDAGYAEAAMKALSLLLGVAILLLATYASAVNWPSLDEWLAEELVTGSWLVYLLLSGQAAVSTVGIWSGMLRVLGPRARMIDDVYSVTPILVIVSALVTSWLLYVLRGSATEPQGDYLSPFSLAITWESRAISYVGCTLLVWKWNYQEGAARRLNSVRAWLRIARTAFLWLPAASWPAIVAAVTVHASSTEPIDLDPGGLDCGIADVPCRHVFNLGVTGASFFIGGSGFVYELIQFDRHNGVHWRARAVSFLFSVWAVVAMLVATNFAIVRRS